MAKTAKKSILSNARALDGIVEPLLLWFYGEKRSLPWREEPTPYRVWISEIMLQQTRVEAVKPYFSRFIEALPDVHALAEADENAGHARVEAFALQRLEDFDDAVGRIHSRYSQ